MNTVAEIQYYYRFEHHARRVVLLATISGIVVALAALVIALSIVGVLPGGLNEFTVGAYLVGVPAIALFIPMVILLREYNRAGIWIGAEQVRVRFPWEKAQELAWSETLFAVNEGEDYLQASKGKEGLGHVFGKTYYVRLHLEGLLPEQRAQAEQAIAQHVEVRRPRQFTLITLMNNKGEVVARGRLYLFEKEVLCTENRGERRVFFCAPLKSLEAVRPRPPFYIGRMECEAFTIRYKAKDYVVMLGYETTISGNIGNSSQWSVTGYAADWVEELKVRA